MCKKRGDYVHKGESLATFYGAADKFDAAAAEYRSGLVYGPEKVAWEIASWRYGKQLCIQSSGF